MLDKIFNIIIQDHIKPYLNKKISVATEDRVIMGNISHAGEADGDKLKNKVIMSLVNIEEDRISRPVDKFNRQNGQVKFTNPPIFLNLYILFAANFDEGDDGKGYANALQLISYIIQFFQFQNVFSPANSPRLPDTVQELIFDLDTLSFQDLNNLWGILGSKYLPSVLYKVRLVSLSEDFSEGDVPLLHEIQIND